MKIRRLNESKKGLTYDEFTNILMHTPVYYPVFIMIDDWVELYTDNNNLITKGTEVYSEDTNMIDLRTLCPKNIITEIPEECLEFVEYRNKKDVDDQLKMYKTTDKYNI